MVWQGLQNAQFVIKFTCKLPEFFRMGDFNGFLLAWAGILSVGGKAIVLIMWAINLW